MGELGTVPYPNYLGIGGLWAIGVGVWEEEEERGSIIMRVDINCCPK